MNADINEAVEARTDRLMGALGLHESFRDTVESALYDAYHAGRATIPAIRTPDGEPVWWCLIHGKDACEAEPEPRCRVCDDTAPTLLLDRYVDSDGER